MNIKSKPGGSTTTGTTENDEREARLWEVEGETAIRVVKWFDLLVNLRRAAETVPSTALVQQLLRADPQLLDHDFLWLIRFLHTRFKLEQKSLAHLRQLDRARRDRCPYTAEQYDAAVLKVGTKQEMLAEELGVDRKTLRKHGRPSG